MPFVAKYPDGTYEGGRLSYKNRRPTDIQKARVYGRACDAKNSTHCWKNRENNPEIVEVELVVKESSNEAS